MSAYKLTKYFLFVVILLIQVACSSKPTVKKIPPTANPTDEVSMLEQDIEKAQMSNVDILAPKNFQKAKDYLESAKDKFNRGKSSEESLRDVELGNAYLTRANASADVARDNTESVLAARQAALRANAPLYFEKQFKSADDDYTDLTKDIEKNKGGKIDKIRPKLQSRYLELELNAIKEANLKDSRNIIEMAKREEAKKYAPRTLAVAERSFKETEEYITANRHDRNGISRRSKVAIEDAVHALNITRSAKKTKSISPEEVALMMEKEQQRVAAKESELEITEDILKTTQSALKREKSSQAVQLERTQEQLEEQSASLEAQKKEFESHKKQEEKYEIARKTFSNDEAEVFKQGDDLLIRLKGMEFPSATATIQSKSYPLLSKVKKVIDEFGEGSTIVIQGHTDSVGGKKINQELSAKRAEAVKQYLQSILEKEDRLEAVGYGDEKPLAGNKTSKGRAQNRRVDIIIKPESTRL